MKTICSHLFIVGDEVIYGIIEHVDILFTQPLWLFTISGLPCGANQTRQLDR